LIAILHLFGFVVY